jgi:hypothetical protein
MDGASTTNDASGVTTYNETLTGYTFLPDVFHKQCNPFTLSPFPPLPFIRGKVSFFLAFLPTSLRGAPWGSVGPCLVLIYPALASKLCCFN